MLRDFAVILFVLLMAVVGGWLIFRFARVDLNPPSTTTTTMVRIEGTTLLLREEWSMPAEKFTKKATTATKKRQWKHVYDTAKAEGDSEGKAIKKASGVLKKEAKK